MEPIQDNPRSVIILHSTDRLLRVGQFTMREAQLVMQGFAIGLMPQGAVDMDGMISNADLINPAIKELITSKNMSGQDAAYVFGGRGIVSGVVQMPRLTPANLAAAMEPEITRYVSWTPGEYLTTFIPMPALPHEKLQDVLYFAALSAPVDISQNALANAGVETSTTEPALSAALRTVIEPGAPEGRRALVYFGDRTTDIALHKDGNVLGVRTLFFGFTNIIQDLAEAVKRDEKSVFDLLLKRYIDMSAPSEGEGKDPLVKRVKKLLEPFAAELGRALEQLAKYEENKPGSITLCGEIGRFRNMDAFFSQQLGIPVSLAKPLIGVDTKPTGLSRSGLEAIGPELGALIGAAHAMLDPKPPLAVNLRAKPKIEAPAPAPPPERERAAPEIKPTPAAIPKPQVPKFLVPAPSVEVKAPETPPFYEEEFPSAPVAPAAAQGKLASIVFFVLCLLIIFFPVILWKVLVSRSDSVEQKIEERQAAVISQLNQLKKAQDNSSVLKSYEETLKPRYDLYLAVVNERRLWSLTLEEMIRVLDPDTVLTQLKADEKPPVVVRGLISSPGLLRKMETRMEDSKWFKNVDEIRVMRERGTKQFSFDMRLEFEEWAPVVPSEKAKNKNSGK